MAGPSGSAVGVPQRISLAHLKHAAESVLDSRGVEVSLVGLCTRFDVRCPDAAWSDASATNHLPISTSAWRLCSSYTQCSFSVPSEVGDEGQAHDKKR